MSSEYERLRNENIRRNEDFMMSLGLDGLKQEITETIVSARPAKGATQKGKSGRGIKREPTEPLRRSSRSTEAREIEQIALLRLEGKDTEADIKQKELDENKKRKLANDYEANIAESYVVRALYSPPSHFFNRSTHDSLSLHPF